MKKLLLPTLAVGVILFVWQFLSWAALNIHGAEQQYTPNQEAVLQVLSEQLEAGSYFLPLAAPGSTADEQEAFMKEHAGKPWAIVHYREAFEVNMAAKLIRGFVIDLVAGFLLVWLLSQMAQADMKRAVLASLAVGFMAYLSIPYLNSIWFEGNTLGHLVDAIVPWGLSGLFLGWWMNR